MQSRKRTGIMLAKPFEQRYLDAMPEYVLFQPKLDGVRVRAKWSDNLRSYILYSSTGLILSSVPHIVGALNKLASTIREHYTFDGEIYAPNLKLQEIMSIVSKTTSIDQYHWMVSYHIFDIIDNRQQQTRSFDLLGDIQTFAQTNDHIDVVPSCTDRKTRWQSYVSRFVDIGYEGVIIRDPTALYTFGKVRSILKVKPQRQDEYIITGCEQAISIGGEPKGMVGAFDLVDSLSNHFQAGAGRLSHDERTMWWHRKEELPGKICVVKYLTLTERGVPREPVTIEIKEKRNEKPILLLSLI